MSDTFELRTHPAPDLAKVPTWVPRRWAKGTVVVHRGQIYAATCDTANMPPCTPDWNGPDQRRAARLTEEAMGREALRRARAAARKNRERDEAERAEWANRHREF